MNLWIRSQSKETLMKVTKVHICDSVIFANGYTEFDERIGAYKTKERAIEVLDEIQYKIKNMYILENCKLPKDSCIEQSLAMDDFNIYQMPEK